MKTRTKVAIVTALFCVAFGFAYISWLFGTVVFSAVAGAVAVLLSGDA